MKNCDEKLYEIAFVTTSNEEEAEKIAEYLVSNHLVACVNIISGIKSIYIWENNLEKDSECLMIIKSRKDFRKQVMEKVKELHSYDNPECIFLSITDGLKNYLNWIDKSLNVIKK